jgi:hypothetical protein
MMLVIEAPAARKGGDKRKRVLAKCAVCTR